MGSRLYDRLRLPVAPAWAGGERATRKLLELQVKQQQVRSMEATLGAFQDVKELRALKHLVYRIYGRAGRIWFTRDEPGIAHVGFYSGRPTAFDPRARQSSVQFKGATYREIFDQVAMWKASRQ